MLNDIVIPLTQWYRQNKRSLPWRDRHNAYYTWVSEIMLQQTRVEAVKPYFQRFIEELPDVEALAECPEEKLLKLWEGLGYYNRVRNMQLAAQTVMQEYLGVLPASYEALLYSGCNRIHRIRYSGSGGGRKCTSCDNQNYRERWGHS